MRDFDDIDKQMDELFKELLSIPVDTNLPDAMVGKPYPWKSLESIKGGMKNGELSCICSGRSCYRF
jgi:hypothetical protein